MRADHEERLRSEIATYDRLEQVHELPEAHHYWANRHLLPRVVDVLRVPGVREVFVEALMVAREAAGDARCEVVSIGAGDCSLEVDVAAAVRERGISNVRIECVEINPHLLERGRTAAARRGVGDMISYRAVDAGDWRPARPVHLAIANHSLHHMVELERLFASVASGLAPGGRFVAADMIGRNGHMCWPEVLEIIEPLWSVMPERYKYNWQLRRTEPEFVNWDCSQEGFEGIRAQDILPLLLESFAFEAFLGFGGLPEILVGRSFGRNLDMARDDDRRFVDLLQRLTDDGLGAGSIKPTMMIAVMSAEVVEDVRCYRDWTPEFCVRPPDRERL